MRKKIHIGLKLRTTDLMFLDEVYSYYDRGIYNYIELYVVPGTFEQTQKEWNSVDIPVIIHAPHGGHGVNLADPDLRESNRRCYDEVKCFADIASSHVIIAHAGNNGTLEEAIRQLNIINDKRIYIENKPVKGIGGENCLGGTPGEIKKIFSETNLSGFVLDFGHAVCAARTYGLPPLLLIKRFMLLKPKVFHLSDGDNYSEKDMHLNLGQGNFRISDFLNMLPVSASLTLETPRNSANGLNDFKKDAEILNGILAESEMASSIRTRSSEGNIAS